MDLSRLSDFDLQVRLAALGGLLSRVERGEIHLPAPVPAVNMHCHTFFSYNGYDYSPTALAWLGRMNGLQAMGIVDFDVLDGVDEFLAACDRVGLRCSAGMETRVFIPEFASREINSPGEPGIFYHMGIGFVSSQAPASVARILNNMRACAAQRNMGVVERINAYLDPVTIDYESDVLPLTPRGNATERHITTAYVAAAERLTANPAAFWAGRLGMVQDQVAALVKDRPGFNNLVRSRLMKQGGAGYVEPDYASFPSVREVNELIVACGAIPCATWLDGTLPGEQAEEELLDLLIGQGVAALNIVPDRNWNIKDAAEKQLKLAKLYEVVDLARSLDLPIYVGTEMNRHGLKLVDDFDAPELAPVRDVFLDGAMFACGHTAAQRALGIGYQSEWARHELPGRRERNAFYMTLGRRLPPGAEGLSTLAHQGVRTPHALLATL